ncbi:NDMA-dependent alcohol dehydrogenase [Aeromicrobium fastidiosum]|uniref:NDMA-dependent alcohol dehydrogenase n=1 Tax=Aeromicrobium fastidiosum TaxID=52699 RepID=A0A641ASQ0_9ACTN|nr:NDMA-dependent alcohol dehydrogenase [Aeromicrobium fastidiosum]KAA1379918.1 NDMA-dependent alcohol dehydrogenase [Aeromicrobium fastidiosum]MBP2389424.1 S-(hydroxymethyl)glutathione dehydrogenase/alcohol dehydrogenase [Aeromicrobium fastidiosum]
MQTRAAIIRESPGKFEIATLELDAPRHGELLVKMVAAGLCHSDDHMQTGDMPPGHMPIITGHEGGGIVEEVGPGTEGFEVGDHVIFSFIPSCGECRFCAMGLTNLCNIGAFLMFGSRLDDPEDFRLKLPDGTGVGQSCSIGTLSEYTVVSTHSAIKVDKDLPLDKLCLLGCGVGTGLGSAFNGAEVKAGDVVIVMGAGGIGSNAVQGAKIAGATTVIVVDPVKFKRDNALTMGATHVYDNIAEATAYAQSITNGQGADSAIVSIGVVHGEHIADAFAAIRKGGTVVVTGIMPFGEVGIPISAMELTLLQKRIQGVLFGACNPRADIPRQIEMYRAGQLKLDELVTTKYRLDDVHRAYEDLNAGVNIRGVITFD